MGHSIKPCGTLFRVEQRNHLNPGVFSIHLSNYAGNLGIFQAQIKPWSSREKHPCGDI